MGVAGVSQLELLRDWIWYTACFHDVLYLLVVQPTNPVCSQFSYCCKSHSRHAIILREVSSLFFEIFILVFSDHRNVIPVVSSRRNVYH